LAQVRRTARAEEDLLEIGIYIAQDDPGAAGRLLDRIDFVSKLLADNPRMGPSRFDLALGLRCFRSGSYLILYREIQEGIEIVRVVHGARNLPTLFDMM
jgi:toxin ParE1/3/4